MSSNSRKLCMAWHKHLDNGMRGWVDFFFLKDMREEKIDKTLFIKKAHNQIILVQVYVDDIIFGLTN